MSYFSKPIEKMGSTSITHADFKLFLALWNQGQNLKTPDLHFRIAQWLEYSWERGDKSLLLMVFRSAGKSTLMGLFCAWLLYRDRNLRMLVLAADQALAGKMVRNVKRVIERHPLCEGMRPKNPDQWASDRFTVRRGLELRDPSMLARGVQANLTGSRADLVICDDVEVPNTCDSADKRADLREKLGELSFILVPGGTQIYIGTPHHYFSIYAREARHEIGEDAPFLNGFKRLEVPVLDAQGQSAWPDRFSLAQLKNMRAHSGPAKFNSQMMLRPTNIAEGRLNPDLLHFYDAKAHYSRILNRLEIGETQMVGASAYWDPAFGSAKGDHSVVAIVFEDAKGLKYLHHIEYIRITPAAEAGGEGSDMDEATQQCRIVADLVRRFYLPSIAVEINGIGRFLPGLLRNALVAAGAPCAVKEVVSSQKKEVRILEAFDAILAARRLYASGQVRSTPFVAEMREWRPERSRGHDDGLDAVAGALMQSPLRIERLYARGGHRWMRGQGGAHKASSDFQV